MAVDTTAVARKAAATWFAYPDRSLLRFYNVTAAAARGTGVRHKPDLDRITSEVRRKMKLFDAEPAKEAQPASRRA